MYRYNCVLTISMYGYHLKSVEYLAEKVTDGVISKQIQTGSSYFPTQNCPTSILSWKGVETASIKSTKQTYRSAKGINQVGITLRIPLHDSKSLRLKNPQNELVNFTILMSMCMLQILVHQSQRNNIFPSVYYVGNHSPRMQGNL